MVEIERLLKTLNPTCHSALDGAVGLCRRQTNPNVEVEHWLLKLAEVADGDVARIVAHFGLDASRLEGELMKVVDGLPRGDTRGPTLAPSIEAWLREAWVLASVQFGWPRVRSGALLAALLGDDRLGRASRAASRELAKVKATALIADLPTIVAGSIEDAPGSEAGAAGPGAATSAAPAGPSKTPALDQFTVDLTARAKAGLIDPIVGREAEVRQMVDILVRRRQNNPILTGEAGVGKTAVVEGLARRIATGDVPPPLRDVAIRSLDLGSLQAGAGVKGEFESRLKGVLAEVKASPRPIILFIDEAHTLIGAGGQAGQGDAANMLKPALARGELRTIAATTWAEYKKYFEKDAALARRFQVVKVEEPDEDRAIVMIRGLVGLLEGHHGVRVLDEAVEASVRLSARYISGRQLPDKAVSLLDTACARAAIGRDGVPPAVEDARRRIDALKVEIEILNREAATDPGHEERLADASRELAEAEAELAGLEERWGKEKGLVTELVRLRDAIEAGPGKGNGKTRAKGKGKADLGAADPEALRGELEARRAELKALQGEAPLMQVGVDAQTIAAVVAGWTGIPVGRMMTDEIRGVLGLKATLEARVIGQQHALEAVSQRVRTSRASLTDPRRPNGVFLLVGPSGVGKTETAMALAEALYGGERNLVILNMSEYQEAYSVSGLKGSPPGYVGYGEGGVLTEAVRRRPYSAVLLDEIEKAHRDVIELFYQVFDKGMLEDSEGREVDFKHTVILMTSNVGSETIHRLCADPANAPGPGELAEALRLDLLAAFPAAFLGRLTLVPYYPIGDETMRQVVRLQLDRIGRRVLENHRAAFSYDDAVVAEIAARCHEVESGARNVDHILTKTLLPELSEQFLARMAAGERVARAHVALSDRGGFRYEIE